MIDQTIAVKAMQEFYSKLDKEGKLPKGFIETVNKTRVSG